MALMTTVTAGAGIPRYYDRRLLAMAEPIMVHYQLCQKGRSVSLPNGTGHTVYWTRYLPITKRVTALTETTDGGISPVAISDMQVTATAELYGHIAHIGRYIDLIHIDQNVANRVDLLARNMGESVDYLVMDAIHGGDHATNRIRIDNDASYTFEATADAAGSTVIIKDASISANTGSTDNYWNGGYAICTDESSKAYGEVRLITDYTHSSGSVLVGTAFSADMSSTKFRIVASDGIATTTDNMSTAGVRYAIRELKRKKALKFDGGTFAAILPTDCEHDFMGDTTWVAAKTYSEVTDLYKGEVGKWMGTRFITPSVEGDWREAAGTMGTLSATGAVYVVPFFGKEAVGVVDLAQQPQKVYVRSWEQLGQEIPLYSSVGWEASLATKVLNGNFAVGLMCSATA